MRIILTIIALLSLVGCKARPVADVEQVRPLTGISSAVARVEVRADVINGLIDQAETFQIKNLVTFIREQTSGIKADVVEANKQLNAATDAAAVAQDRLSEANATIVQLSTDLKAEQDHWLGRKSRVLMAWIVGVTVGAWALLGTLAVILSVASPTGAGLVWGKRIIRFLPLANPFSWLRDRAIRTAT